MHLRLNSNAFAFKVKLFGILFKTYLRFFEGDIMEFDRKKSPKRYLLGPNSWTTRIRTWTNRTKTCCATITP